MDLYATGVPHFSLALHQIDYAGSISNYRWEVRIASFSAMNIFALFEKTSNSNLREDVVSMLIVIALIRPLMIKS